MDKRSTVKRRKHNNTITGSTRCTVFIRKRFNVFGTMGWIFKSFSFNPLLSIFIFVFILFYFFSLQGRRLNQEVDKRLQFTLNLKAQKDLHRLATVDFAKLEWTAS
jgi:uncharacterized membrane protein